jgi:hypothetical protein
MDWEALERLDDARMATCDEHRPDAFADMRIRRTNRVVGDDAVGGEVEFSGTNTGPIAVGSRQVQPTGKAIVTRGAYFARVKDGSSWRSAHPDLAGVMTQPDLTP